jgi:hypothetical protein
LFVFERSLFSPILRPSEVPGADDVSTSPLRLTAGAARTVSCAQSLHGLLSSLVVGDDVFLEGPTVGVVVAERFDGAFVDGMAHWPREDLRELFNSESDLNPKFRFELWPYISSQG